MKVKMISGIELSRRAMEAVPVMDDTPFNRLQLRQEGIWHIEKGSKLCVLPEDMKKVGVE